MEIGFFNDNQFIDNKYFIALNRYYSNINSIKFTFKDLSEYNNWTVFNFNDTLQTFITTDINNQAVFTDVIQPGDGKLYGLIPTIITGGTLNANETISTGSNITVNNTLIVAAGKTLTIEENCNIIFIEDASLIVNGGLIINPGVSFIFNNGSSLVINNYIEINGTENNKIIFDFLVPANNNGIKIEQGADAIIQHAIIKNANKGIFLNQVSPSIESSVFEGNNYGLFAYLSSYELTAYEGAMFINNEFINNNTGI